MSNWLFENHQPQRTQFPPSVTLLSFKTRIKWRLLLTATANFPSVFFQLLQYSRQHPSFPNHKVALMTKTDLFQQHFVDFAVQFVFRCKSSLTVAWFLWTNHNSLERITTNEIASFCIDNRLHQMAFFVFAEVDKGRLSSYWERYWNKKAVVVCFFII